MSIHEYEHFFNTNVIATIVVYGWKLFVVNEIDGIEAVRLLPNPSNRIGVSSLGGAAPSALSVRPTHAAEDNAADSATFGPLA